MLTHNQPDLKCWQRYLMKIELNNVYLKLGVTCAISFQAGYLILLAMEARKK